jgi:hypothetical protein
VRNALRALVLVALAASPAAAQTTPPPAADILSSGRRTMTAERMRDDEHIVLDGVLDEAIWVARAACERLHHAGPGARRASRPSAPKSASRSTRTGSTSAPRSSIPNPTNCKGNTRKRDEFLSADDRFMWTMDTFLNQQTGYFFEMNPAGLMADALMGPGGTNSPRMGRHLERARAAAARSAGWSRSTSRSARLAFDPTAEAWGINFQRTVRRKNEGAAVDRSPAEPGPAPHGERPGCLARARGLTSRRVAASR